MTPSLSPRPLLGVPSYGPPVPGVFLPSLTQAGSVSCSSWPYLPRLLWSSGPGQGLGRYFLSVQQKAWILYPGLPGCRCRLPLTGCDLVHTLSYCFSSCPPGEKHLRTCVKQQNSGFRPSCLGAETRNLKPGWAP